MILNKLTKFDKKALLAGTYKIVWVIKWILIKRNGDQANTCTSHVWSYCVGRLWPEENEIFREDRSNAGRNFVRGTNAAKPTKKKNEIYSPQQQEYSADCHRERVHLNIHVLTDYYGTYYREASVGKGVVWKPIISAIFRGHGGSLDIFLPSVSLFAFTSASFRGRLMRPKAVSTRVVDAHGILISYRWRHLRGSSHGSPHPPLRRDSHKAIWCHCSPPVARLLNSSFYSTRFPVSRFNVALGTTKRSLEAGFTALPMNFYGFERLWSEDPLGTSQTDAKKCYKLLHFWEIKIIKPSQLLLTSPLQCIKTTKLQPTWKFFNDKENGIRDKIMRSGNSCSIHYF